ncbi:isopentenyl-diphosphate Delta-isomerase [Rhodosalinus halophilus]|uniref:Isopentenyl-diphosphate Delta-isomerase n=1 Tax=Rhodosalinus halophilus TaxID=2259333 RepID=A0A365U7C1_9RHOB|nr:isopentenyl-diphosphate Delta-isomerase [Rhodosalinus halophilus]RBI84532.1 isopentenyl-diphosphate Delta-isomerase [Rhodosalinus halophilus]
MTLTLPAWVGGTLMPVEKLEAHRRGLRHKAVSVFVLHGEEVLLQRRALGKYHTPGLWANTCCTHPHWDEPPEACARRRLAEELGITGLPLVHRGRVEYRADVGGGLIEHEVVEIFTAGAPDRIVPDPDPDEVLETRWMPLAALHADVRRAPERYTPWLRIYLDQHAEDIFGRVPA